jgi:ABC-type microcin C transport system permease subunit YejB
MNDTPQALDPQPLIDALTRQRNEQSDRVAHAEAALFSTQAALQQTLAAQAKTQSMLDDTLVAMTQQQNLYGLDKEEHERVVKALNETIVSQQRRLDAMPVEVPADAYAAVEALPA